MYNSNNMKLESVGILINLRPIGERDSVARIFTYDFGVMCGVMRAGQIARKNRPLVGQMGAVAWNARLDSQLGTFHWEPEKNLSSPIMCRPVLLDMMNSAFALISALVPEREQYKHLYTQTIKLLKQLPTESGDAAYLQWETELLRELGYGLNLGLCGACGTHDDLMYISPRTGRAICKNCGAPYADRLYKMPLDLNTTYKFIERAAATQGTELPFQRRLIMRA